MAKLFGLLTRYYDGAYVMRRWWKGSGVRLHLLFYGVFFTLLGASLLLEPHRWQAGPSFELLLLRVSPRLWGAVAVGVAVLKYVAAARYPRTAVLAITAGSVFCAVWAVYCAVAYVAAPGEVHPFAALFTTAVLFHHLRALAQVDLKRDDRQIPVPPPPPPGPVG